MNKSFAYFYWNFQCDARWSGPHPLYWPVTWRNKTWMESLESWSHYILSSLFLDYLYFRGRSQMTVVRHLLLVSCYGWKNQKDWAKIKFLFLPMWEADTFLHWTQRDGSEAPQWQNFWNPTVRLRPNYNNLTLSLFTEHSHWESDVKNLPMWESCIFMWKMCVWSSE